MRVSNDGDPADQRAPTENESEPDLRPPDDALIGVRSSALRMGSQVRGGVAVFYGVALAFWAAAIWQIRPDALALAALLPVTIHFAWQVGTLKIEDGGDALTKFRSNRFAGFLMALACAVVGTASLP